MSTITTGAAAVPSLSHDWRDQHAAWNQGANDGWLPAHIASDGIVVATPTGSTAYSLSAGGPVLMPSVDAFVITPVAPHSFSHRPLVVPGSVEIQIMLRSGNEFAYLSLDGQPGMDLFDGDRVCCRRSVHNVSLFRTNDNFFEVLRSKLKWGEG